MKSSLSISTCFSILAALALVVASCGGDSTPATPENKGCAINSECDDPLVCAFKRCHSQCMYSRDCAIGLRCVQARDVDTGMALGATVCQLPDEATNKCTINSECPGTQICGIDGKCRDQCALDKDCLREQVCTEQTCADKVELNDKGGLDMVIDMVVTRDASGPSGDDGGATTSTTMTTGMGGGTGMGGSSGTDAGTDVSVGGSGGTDAGTDSTTADVSKDMVTGPCGHNGEQCCTGNTCTLGSACNTSGTCVTCGNKGQPCCGNQCMDSNNLDCVNNVCSCGESNQVCCGGTTCSGGLTCTSADAGMRSSCACGGNSQACCPNMMCNGQSLKCAGLKCSCVVGCSGDRTNGGEANLIRTDGTVWFYNGYSYQTQAVKDASAVVVTGFKKVATGQGFSCGIKIDKTIWCWGNLTNTAVTDSYGELGDSTNAISKAPVQVVTNLGGPALTGGVDISTFGSSTCAVVDAGTADGADDSVWCWGYNYYGQLGSGVTSTYSNFAQRVVANTGELANVDQVSMGSNYACAHQRSTTAGEAGFAWCWGLNNYGQLGVGGTQGTPPSSNVALKVSTLLSGVSQVATSVYITCARTGPDVWCWGNGNVGDGMPGVKTAPVQVLAAAAGAPFTGATDLRSSYGGPCVLKTDNSVYCWYYNSVLYPTLVSPAGFPLTSVAYWDNYGYNYLCFARTDGDVYFHAQKPTYPVACPP